MADCELGNLRQEICDLKTALATLVLNAAHPPAHLTNTVGAFAWDDDTQVGNIPIVTVPATPAPEVVVVADTSARTSLAPQKLNQLLIQTTDAANGNFSVWSATGLVAGNWTLKTGTLGSQNANAVSITGGSISGVNPIALISGGTGAASAQEARLTLNLPTQNPLADNIDWLLATTFVDTLNANVTYTFDNVIDGLTIYFVVNNAVGSLVITWPGTVYWEGGVTPTPGASGTADLYTFTAVGGYLYGRATQGYPG